MHQILVSSSFVVHSEGGPDSVCSQGLGKGFWWGGGNSVVLDTPSTLPAEVGG